MEHNQYTNGVDAPNQAFAQGRDVLQASLFEVLLRHRWTILLSTAVCLVVAVLYLLKATPIYTSTSRLYVEQTGPKIMTESEGVMTQSKNYLYTQGELITSTPIVATVVDNPQIARLKTFTETPKEDSRSGGVGMLFDHVKDKFDVPTDKPDEGMVDNRTLFLKNNLDVSVGKKDDIIAVSFNSPYPDEAAQIVNAVVASYIQYHASRKKSTAAEVLKILGTEKERRDKELKDTFDDLLEFTKANGVISLESSNQHVAFKRLDKLSSALTDAQLETIKAKSQYDVVLGMIDDPEKVKRFAMEQANSGVQVFVTDVETELRAEKRNLEIEVKALQEYCTDDHPAMQALLGKIAKIDGQLEDEAKKFADTYLDVTRLEWTTAQQREGELQASYDLQEAEARDVSVQATQYYVLQSNLRRTEKLCEILDDRIKEINVTEDAGALNINILETARPAIHPSAPQKARVMAMALVLGLMLGGGLALLRDMMDARLRSSDEIAAALALPVIGTVPMMPGKESIQERGQKVQKESMSHVSEAFRTIRTSLFFGVPKGKGQVFLVTSPTPGDGKSSMVSNLAIAMAQGGQRTLILDADLRKPMQHQIFEIETRKGLNGLLSGQIALKEAVVSGPVKGLDILPCPSGPEVPNPSEMLNSPAFSELLGSLRKQYDRIIIDSPPAAAVTDSHILSVISDTTLLVVKAEATSRRLAQQARDALLAVGGHLFGVIVNAVPRKHNRYGYYSYKYYGYGQDKGKTRDERS